MDLESPLRTIASPVEAETLRVLAGSDVQFSASQVQRLTDSASAFGVRKALARLANAGLVLSAVHGRTTLWQGNRQHVLWPAIEMAVNAKTELVDRIRNQFAERNEIAVFLYGSFARGIATNQSDIDLLLVYPDDTAHERMIDASRELSEHIRAWTGNEGHIFTITRSDLRDSLDRSDPIVVSIREDAVPVVGPDFSQFARALTQQRRSVG